MHAVMGSAQMSMSNITEMTGKKVAIILKLNKKSGYAHVEARRLAHQRLPVLKRLEATKLGIKIVPILTRDKPSREWKGLTGRLTQEMLTQQVTDYKEPIYYISGPNALVHAYKDLLKQAGVSSRSVVTDYFSGY